MNSHPQSEQDADIIEPHEEVAMQTQKKSSRNPIAKSFGAGINQPKIVPGKRRDRRVKHRKREIEHDG